MLSKYDERRILKHSRKTKDKRAKVSWIDASSLQRIVWIGLLLLLWELIARSGRYDSLLFPSLGQISEALFFSLREGTLLQQTAYTLKLIGEGFVLAMGIALLLALLAYNSKILEGLVETLTSIAHPLPGLALLPLIILWLGTGAPSIVFIIVHSVLWPFLLNILTGFKSIPKVYRQIGQNYELGRFQIFYYILVPASFPYVLAGLKTGWARAWRAVIGAEMVFGAAGGTGGIGWYIFKQRVFMDTAGMFAGIFMIVLVGVFVEDLFLSQLEKRTIKKWGMSI